MQGLPDDESKFGVTPARQRVRSGDPRFTQNQYECPSVRCDRHASGVRRQSMKRRRYRSNRTEASVLDAGREIEVSSLEAQHKTLPKTSVFRRGIRTPFSG